MTMDIDAPLAGDEDVATFEVCTGPNLLRYTFSAPQTINRSQMLFRTAGTGPRTYVLRAWNALDASDVVVLDTFAFTATGLLQNITREWGGTAPFRYYQLDSSSSEDVDFYEWSLWQFPTGTTGTDHMHLLDDLFDVDVAGAVNGQLLGYRDGHWVPVSPGGILQLGVWRWDVSGSTPGVGRIGTLTEPPAASSPNTLIINEQDTSGNDRSPWLDRIQTGDIIAIDDGDGNVWQHEVTGAPVDSGTYRSIPIVYDPRATTPIEPANNASCGVYLLRAGGSGGGGGGGGPVGALGQDVFTGGGVATTFVLSAEPGGAVLVTVNGVQALPSAYTLTGDTLVFDTAPADEAEIIVTYGVGGPGGGGPAVEDPVEVLFGTPATAYEFDSSDLTGLTAIGTPDAEDADTTIPGCLYLRDDATGGAWVGRQFASPSMPFTVIAKILDVSLLQNYNTAGLMVGADIASGSGAFMLAGMSYNSARSFVFEKWNNRTTFGTPANGGAANPPTPGWVAIVVNSDTDYRGLYSMNGYIWRTMQAAYNPGLTTSRIGIGMTSQHAQGMAVAFDYVRVFAGALVFPGV